MNQGFIAGHLAADPEVRFTTSGKKVTTFRLGARSRKDSTIWWRVTVWGEQFDKIIAYLKKGSGVMVFGDIHKPEVYTNKEGNAQVSIELTATNILFNPFGKTEGAANSAATTTIANPELEMAFAATAETISGQGKIDLPFSDEELPF